MTAAERFVRWPTIGELEGSSWRERDVPPGYRLAWYRQHPDWEVVTGGHPQAGRPCRHMANRRQCGNPAAAVLYRATHYRSGTRRQPWAYCAEHLFGNRIEDGCVIGLRLVEREEVPT